MVVIECGKNHDKRVPMWHFVSTKQSNHAKANNLWLCTNYSEQINITGRPIVGRSQIEQEKSSEVHTRLKISVPPKT